MKVALITDQHLDGRKGSLAFWDYFQKFYDNVFFPTLEKEDITTVIDLGDTFDNRKSMDFNTFHRVKTNYFDRLKDYKVHMLLGNHCTYYKNTNRINSPELLLEQYDNITIYSEPKHLKLGSKKFLMLPWINKENLEEVLGLLETSEADNCCGHLELTGFEVTPGMKMDHGMDPTLFHRLSVYGLDTITTSQRKVMSSISATLIRCIGMIIKTAVDSISTILKVINLSLSQIPTRSSTKSSMTTPVWTTTNKMCLIIKTSTSKLSSTKNEITRCSKHWLIVFTT